MTFTKAEVVAMTFECHDKRHAACVRIGGAAQGCQCDCHKAQNAQSQSQVKE